MKSLSFRKDLVGVQDELLRFAYKLTTDREEANDLLQETSLKALDNEDKYTPDTNFKGWMYTIMRNIFINNYRKVVRDQTFIDRTDNLYHLNLPQDAGFESTEKVYDLISSAVFWFEDSDINQDIKHYDIVSIYNPDNNSYSQNYEIYNINTDDMWNETIYQYDEPIGSDDNKEENYFRSEHIS